MKRRRRLGGVLVHLVLIIGALFWLAPLLLALMNSFKTNGELLTNVLSLPKALSFENYARTLDKMHYFRSLGNTVLLYHGFVKGIPQELEEAAEMDGCGQFQVFWYMVFPLLKPITATVCITNVLWVWNDFLLPLIVISDNKKYTLLLSTNTLFGQYSSDWTAILSALIIAALPVIVFYAFFQKQILRGISEGALKG